MASALMLGFGFFHVSCLVRSAVGIFSHLGPASRPGLESLLLRTCPLCSSWKNLIAGDENFIDYLRNHVAVHNPQLKLALAWECWNAHAADPRGDQRRLYAGDALARALSDNGLVRDASILYEAINSRPACDATIEIERETRSPRDAIEPAQNDAPPAHLRRAPPPPSVGMVLRDKATGLLLK